MEEMGNFEAEAEPKHGVCNSFGGRMQYALFFIMHEILKKSASGFAIMYIKEFQKFKMFSFKIGLKMLK